MEKDWDDFGFLRAFGLKMNALLGGGGTQGSSSSRSIASHRSRKIDVDWSSNYLLKYCKRDFSLLLLLEFHYS
jgi:hypothetical protein